MNDPRSRFWTIWLGVLVLLAAPLQLSGENSAEFETIDLRPRFVPGQWSRYELWVTRDQVVSRPAGQPRRVATRLESDGEVLWKVDKVGADGSATCSMLLEWMTLKITLPDGRENNNDSRKSRGDDKRAHGLLKAMSSVTLKVKVGADGSVLSLKGVDAMRERAAEGVKLPDELDFIETAADLATLSAAPSKAKVGQRWKTDFQWNHAMGKLDQPMKYRLDSIEMIEGIPIATVSGNSKLRLQVDASKLPSKGPKMNVRLTQGRTETQVMFDIDRHEAIGRNTITSHQVQVRVQVGGRSAVSSVDTTTQSQVLRVAEGS